MSKNVLIYMAKMFPYISNRPSVLPPVSFFLSLSNEPPPLPSPASCRLFLSIMPNFLRSIQSPTSVSPFPAPLPSLHFRSNPTALPASVSSFQIQAPTSVSSFHIQAPSLRRFPLPRLPSPPPPPPPLCSRSKPPLPSLRSISKTPPPTASRFHGSLHHPPPRLLLCLFLGCVLVFEKFLNKRSSSVLYHYLSFLTSNIKASERIYRQLAQGGLWENIQGKPIINQDFCNRAVFALQGIYQCFGTPSSLWVDLIIRKSDLYKGRERSNPIQLRLLPFQGSNDWANRLLSYACLRYRWDTKPNWTEGMEPPRFPLPSPPSPPRCFPLPSPRAAPPTPALLPLPLRQWQDVGGPALPSLPTWSRGEGQRCWVSREEGRGETQGGVGDVDTKAGGWWQKLGTMGRGRKRRQLARKGKEEKDKRKNEHVGKHGHVICHIIQIQTAFLLT